MSVFYLDRIKRKTEIEFCTKEWPFCDDVNIPEGLEIEIPVQHLQHDENFIRSPHSLDPERYAYL